MTRTIHRLSLISLALAATLQLAACGGDDAGAPDIFAPTVVITSQAAATVGGPVTFTFTFNEDVGTSFGASDFTVTGGTAGSLTRVSATVYTLLVTPEVGASKITVTVNAKSFSDAAGNQNTASIPKDHTLTTPTEPCSVTEPTCAPTTVIPAGATTIFSDAVAAGNFNPFPNWGQTTQLSEVTIQSNKALKYTNLNYQGMEFDAVDVTTKSKVHFDFWTPNMTAVKVSIISAGAENAVEVPLTKGSWNSVDIDLSQYTVPNKAAIVQIKFDYQPTNGGTLYVDNIYFHGTVATATPLTYASNYTETPTPWKSTQGGDAGRYVADGALDWWSGLASADATPSFYFGYGLLPTDWGFGAYVNAPNNGTATVSSYSNIQLAVWGNDQLVNQSPRPNFNLIMQAPPVTGGCIPEVQKEFQVAGAGVQTYTIALSGMVVRQDCGQTTLNTAAAILATGVKSVHVQVTNANLNKTTAGDASTGRYPNGLNIGPISFK